MQLIVIPPVVNLLVVLAVAAVALWRGDWRARAIACAQAAEFTVSIACRSGRCPLYPIAWPGHAWRFCAEDGYVLAICLFCAARADRYWCILAASFALLGEINDLAIFAPGVSRWSWLSGSLLWSYAVAGAVLWGVLTRQPAGSPGTIRTGWSNVGG